MPTLPGRDDDLVGLSVSWVDVSDHDDAGFVDGSETALETLYKASVTPAASVQPYVQYIANPGGDGLDDAVNLGGRLGLRF